MWTRAELKARAKNVLKGSYWKAFWISVVIAFFDGGVPSVNYNMNLGNGKHTNVFSTDWNSAMPMLKYFLVFFAICLAIGLVIGLILRLFVAYPLIVGGRKYFVRGAMGDVDISHLGGGYQKKYFLNIVKTMFFRDLFTFLWSLLLVIPGIVKSYGYSFAPYILADNPSLEYERVLDLSQQMTHGEKFKMWVLDLSFIGWYLLGTLALLVGVFFVYPYVNGTKAELYLTLRENSIRNGITSYEELNLEPVVLVE